MATGLAMAVIANVALWIVTAVTLAGQGIESIDWPGSILYGAALAGVGLVFAGVAAVTAQVTEHARTASSMAGLVLGLVYTMRAVGDVLESRSPGSRRWAGRSGRTPTSTTSGGRCCSPWH